MTILTTIYLLSAVVLAVAIIRAKRGLALVAATLAAAAFVAATVLQLFGAVRG